MTNTMNATRDQVDAIVNTKKAEATKAEICLGALMATATIAGIWGAASFLISLFVQ